MHALGALLVAMALLADADVVFAACESKKCPASQFGASIEAVRERIADRCRCKPDVATSRARWINCVRRVVERARNRGLLDGTCAKATRACAYASICGKPGTVACCILKVNGSLRARITSRTACEKKGSVCDAFVSAADACDVDGTCASASSSSTSSSTSTSTSTTSSSRPPHTIPPACAPSDPSTLAFDFTTAKAAGACGAVRDGDGTTLADLACGALDVGGARSVFPEGHVPDGGVNRFEAVCSGDECMLAGSGCAGILPNGGTLDCTTTGCTFGPPLPIAAGGVSLCAVLRFVAPTSGTLDMATGDAAVTLPLEARTHLTGDHDAPCPYCTADIEATDHPQPLIGSPTDPKVGTCAGGASPGASCVTTNSQGLTRDCLPGGVSPVAPCTSDQPCADGSFNLGEIELPVVDATTASSTLAHADGLFCPGQGSLDPPRLGCFGFHTSDRGDRCRTISVGGVPAGRMRMGTPAPMTLASTFCIPELPQSDLPSVLEFAADVPGPGAMTLVGTGTLSRWPR